ncbi:hypothetical protein [Agrobacterium vaccinii]|uniref:hypothetical protein n=1 Tax=Agrobacterium vaccinii TaxID=2735528 RepID=UPI001E2CAAC2|nr:hypothetical protein [Agrobacterium vaccinii]UHS56088.1 hypothetical protein HRS00_04320 [Agrobacterium vaccinii]
MHSLNTSFVLGYHGCSKTVAASLLNGDPFRPSENAYDWLGKGIYFWEANPRRGIEFFRDAQVRKERDPNDVAVVGAILDLGFCLDLSSSRGVDAISNAYTDLKAIFQKIPELDMPSNKLGDDLLLRELDCAVINHLHSSRERAGLQKFDSVRGIFQEGETAYPNSGFKTRTHVQIAVCNPAKIRGVFRVPSSDL